MRTILFSIIFIFVSFNMLYSQSKEDCKFNCFSILVGKGASVDGSVMVAHNEDESGELLLNWYKVPRITHKIGDNIKLNNGGTLNQVKETNSFLWLEMPGLEFGDSYMNEYGVTITSDQCQSKETEGEFVNGGIGYWLRRIMAERAKSAKDAVKIAGKIIDSLGYVSSGRTYCIADTKEAWIMAVVKGKHWIAQRVPDGEIVAIPNYYIIQQINLKDTNNFLGSPDIVDYAIKKGWYDPNSGKEFNFRIAYSNPEALNAASNISRQWVALNMLSEKQYNYNDEFPFSIKPKNKVSVQNIIEILRSHDAYSADTGKFAKNSCSPDKTIGYICSNFNSYGFVAHLRNWLPKDIGIMMWAAPIRPCNQPFIPWYLGINNIPAEYTTNDYQKATEEHFTVKNNIKELTKDHSYWKFTEYANSKEHGNISEDEKNGLNVFEKKLFDDNKEFENSLTEIYKNNPEQARLMLTNYTSKWAMEALSFTKNKIK